MKWTKVVAAIGLCACCRAGVAKAQVDTLIIEDTAQLRNFTYPAQLFSVEDAESILGETARLQDSVTNQEGRVVTYRCTYKTLAVPTQGKKKRVVYFMLEEYRTAAEAHDIYANIKRANDNHTWLQALGGTGDEAFFLSDAKNYYFIMARKGRRMFRIKATKIGGPTSVDRFNLIASRIIAQL